MFQAGLEPTVAEDGLLTLPISISVLGLQACVTVPFDLHSSEGDRLSLHGTPLAYVCVCVFLCD